MELQQIVNEMWSRVAMHVRECSKNNTIYANKKLLLEVQDLESIYELHDKRMREMIKKCSMRTKSNIQLLEEQERTHDRNAARGVDTRGANGAAEQNVVA